MFKFFEFCYWQTKRVVLYCVCSRLNNQSDGGEVVAYDYSKLMGKIVEICGSQRVFSIKMNWSERTTSMKLNSKRDWKSSEISEACEILRIPLSDIPAYFFTSNVQYWTLNQDGEDEQYEEVDRNDIPKQGLPWYSKPWGIVFFDWKGEKAQQGAWRCYT